MTQDNGVGIYLEGIIVDYAASVIDAFHMLALIEIEQTEMRKKCRILLAEVDPDYPNCGNAAIQRGFQLEILTIQPEGFRL